MAASVIPSKGLSSRDRIPPLRASPTQPDRFDPQRLAWARAHWASQDDALRRRDRQIEENLRMLAGQQWTIWNQFFNRWMDVTEWMTEDEKRWRQRPVINRLLYWFMLHHSRFTENPPIIGFQAATGDRKDSMAAEASDILFKQVWRSAGATDALDTMFSWLIPGGEAFLTSRVDANRGDWKPWVGPAQLQLYGPDGRPTGISRMAPMVPFDKDGQPLARLVGDGSAYEVTGEPHREREGEIVVDVLSALQCRGQWGPTPWHLKRWHCTRTFHTCEEVYELTGEDVPPDTGLDEVDTGFADMSRVLLGSGFFGATEGKLASSTDLTRNAEGLVCLETLWIAPSDFPGCEEDREQGKPGGRLMVTSKTRLIADSARPAPFKYTSPIRRFSFVNLPGRPAGTTPQDSLNPIQRTLNRGDAQILEHRNLVTNPIRLIDKASGLGDIKITGQPGEEVIGNFRPGVKPMDYLLPPQLSEDVWRTRGMLVQDFKELGNIIGAEGAPPDTSDPSGELAKQLLSNSDRFIGATLKRAVSEIARMAEDWIAIVPSIWTQEKILTHVGEDDIARTIVVLPEMFSSAKVHVIPDVESMLPEGRGERQRRIDGMYDRGLLGLPGTPEAMRRYFDLQNFPHMSRAARPGGIDRQTARRENGRLLQGDPALNIPVFEWYDSASHLMEHEEFMKSPDFLQQPPEIQAEFILHRAAHLNHLALQMAQMAAQQAALNPDPKKDAKKGGPAGGNAPPSPATPKPAAAGAA
jgi:hypothetical protein